MWAPQIYEKELRSADSDADEVHRYWVFARGKRLAQIERSHRPSDDSWSERSDYLHYDRLGNVIAMSDENGDLTEEMTYSVYGEPEQALPTAFGYTGHRHEQDLGLVDARGRFYDPKFGVFLSADPASPLGGGSPRMNRYAYVGYDPVNFTDPSGYFIVPMAIAAWQMYGGLVVASAWLAPAFNYVITGDFSYDWSKDTWKAAATVGTVVMAGSLGFGCSAAGGPALGAMCAGAVSGGLGTAVQTRDPGKILSGAVVGSFVSLGSAGVGHVVGAGLSIAVQSVSENPYVQAGLYVSASTGASIGLQAATPARSTRARCSQATLPILRGQSRTLQWASAC